MKGSRTQLRMAVGGALAGVVGLVQAASGQDVVAPPAGLRATLDYGIGIDVDTNRDLDDPSPGTYSALVNSFGLALLSNTRNQSFALTFGTQLRLQSDPESDDVLDWNEPDLRVQYSRDAANSRMALSGRLRQQDVELLEPFFIDIDGDTIVDETRVNELEGTLDTAEVVASLETGVNSPIGTTYTASYLSRTYNDTDDPDLFDRVDYRIGTSTHLRFSSVATGRVGLSARQYEYSNGRDVLGETVAASFGLDYAVSPSVNAEASIGYSKNVEDEEVEGDRFVTTEQGPTFSAGVTRQLRNGDIFTTYRRDLVEDTFRNTLTFGRSISMPRYELSGSFGLTNLDGGDPVPTFGLFYTRDLALGQFTASFRRIVTVNTDDEERTLTAAAAGYSHAITELSSVNFSLDYSLVTGVGDVDEGDDETRATFVASYSRVVTEDWALTVGYRGRMQNDDEEEATSNAVFVNLGRQFTFR